MPRVRRPRRIAELATGESPKKLLGLAQKHSLSSFVGVDKVYVFKRLLEADLRAKGREFPKNLELHGQQDAVEFLRRIERDHFSHVYSHFFLSDVPRRHRLHLFTQLFRTLQPGAKYRTIEFFTLGKEYLSELTAIGFEVGLKFITAKEVRKIGTPASELHGVTQDQLLEAIRRHPTKRQSREMAQSYREMIRGFLLSNEKHPSIGTFRSIERVLSAIPNEFTPEMFQRPFVIITAKKPRK